MAAKGLTNRAYSVTVHNEHSEWRVWMAALAANYEDGIVDYAVVSLEESRAGVLHLQGFVVFNESLDGQPSTVLEGHWTKARSLSGARDYCAGVGIHIDKTGVFATVEFGDWVDPAWNQNLRARKCYEFSRLVIRGYNAHDIARHDPAGYLYVGDRQIDSICAVNFLHVGRDEKSPYYYIGLQQMISELESEPDFSAEEEE